jgi:hypothetical protein
MAQANFISPVQAGSRRTLPYYCLNSTMDREKCLKQSEDGCVLSACVADLVPAARHLPLCRHQKPFVRGQVQYSDEQVLAQYVLNAFRQSHDEDSSE